MCLPLKIIPLEIIKEYNLFHFVHNDFIYIRIEKGMYGLPQAGEIAHDVLIQHLAPFGYHPNSHTPGLWIHDTKSLSFVLTVDDFGIKYRNISDANHLLASLGKKYKYSTDWKGSLYCGITLKWDHIKATVQLSMPGYIATVLQKYQHPIPTKPEHSPHISPQTTYGASHIAPIPDSLAPLVSNVKKNRIEGIVGSLLFYARAMYPIILPAFNDIVAEQSAPTIKIDTTVSKLLDFCSTYPNTCICYSASDMVLHIDSEASYLSLHHARNRAAGHYYLSNASPNSSLPPPNSPRCNGAVTQCSCFRN